MKNKKILITGNKGFIGNSILEKFRKSNKIIGISKNKYLKLKKNTFFNISKSTLDKIPFIPDYIFHCAGTSSVYKSMKYKKKDYNDNFLSTKYLLDYYKKQKKKPVIFIFSSAAVYGNNKVKLRPISNYGKHKLLAEKLSINYSTKFKMKIIILRIYSVYGEKNKKQLFWDVCNKIKRKENIFFGTGEEVRSWLHIDDLISAILKIKQINYFPFIIDIGSFEKFKNKEIIKMFYKEFKSKLSPQFNGEQRIGDPIKQISNNNKIRKIGWHPKIKINQGIKKYVKWFKNN